MGANVLRNVKLDGFEVIGLMPARHCTSDGRMVDERIMAEIPVDCQRQYPEWKLASAKRASVVKYDRE